MEIADGLVHQEDRQSAGVEFVCRQADGLFPLTPALSLGERGTQRPVFRTSRGTGLAKHQPKVLPPPKGEGWGEGEGSILTPRRLEF